MRTTIFTRLSRLTERQDNIDPMIGSSHVIKVLLYGSFIVACLLTILLAISFFALHNNYVSYRFVIGGVILLYLIIASFLYKKARHVAVAWMLVILYCIVGLLILFLWGINAPIGILILGIVVIISSMMLGSKYIIPITIGIISLLGFLQVLNIVGISKPDRSSFIIDSSFADVITYGTILGILALLAWLSRRQIEKSFNNAVVAELTLRKEREQLAFKIKQITQSLKEAQYLEIQQLYRFAELGQITAVTLHELANQLSVLTFDIDELHEKHKKSVAVLHAKESIGHLDAMIRHVRGRLNYKNEPRKFDVTKVVKDTLREIRIKSPNQGVILRFNNTMDPTRLSTIGDPAMFSQSLLILINNAIEATIQSNSKTPVRVELKAANDNLLLSVIDFGIGIPRKQRQKLFEPLRSNKKNGLGLGLYITSQIIENHFKGNLSLDPNLKYTKFTIRLKKA